MPDRYPLWLEDVAIGTGGDLLRFLRSRLSNRADADDLAQEVYIRLLRIKEPGEIRNWRAYVLRVAANVAYEWRLLAKKHGKHSSELLHALPGKEDTFQQVKIDQQMSILATALATLSPKCRAVLLLHRRDQYTYLEIAARMDPTPWSRNT